MGVRDLAGWIRKTYPEVIATYPKRFASPEIRRKRIAIDGTLLTNRFHFANPLDDKSALLGWYNLIRQMKGEGVEPIAIWDERGERPWKAPEARRRLETRATGLARRMHEERRDKRLSRLDEELKGLGKMCALEQAVVLESWRDGCFAPSDSSLSTEEPGHVSATGSAAMISPSAIVLVAIVGRLAAQLERLHVLVEEHRFESTPEERAEFLGRPTQTLVEAFEDEEQEIRSLLLDEGNDLPTLDVMLTDELCDPIDAGAAIDARLAALEPASVYTESSRQKSLTAAEARVYEVVFGKSPYAYFAEDAHLTDTQPEHRTKLPKAILNEGLRQLRLVRRSIPSIKDTYVRQLNVPLERHHAQSRALLRRMGVPVIKAPVPYEAEGLASALAAAGLVDFVATEDSDVIAYGGPLLRNTTASIRPLMVVHSDLLPAAVGLSPASFRDFCILLGTDASARIPNVGPSRALPLMRQYGSIESMLAGEPRIRERIGDEEEFMAMVSNARKLFGELPPLDKDALGGMLVQGEWNVGDVLRWLSEEHGVTPDVRTWRKEEWQELEHKVDNGGPLVQRWRPDRVASRQPGAWDESWGEK